MLRRSLRLLRPFSLDSQLCSLKEKLNTSLSLEELYQVTETCFADPTVLTSDPKIILHYKDTILGIHKKFGHHSQQLLVGVIHPVLTRLSTLPDLSLPESMSIIRLSHSLKSIYSSSISKNVLRSLIIKLRASKTPLEATDAIDLYRAMHDWQILSYELVAELETSQLYENRFNLFMNGSELLQLYADFGLSLERVRPLVFEAAAKELPKMVDSAALLMVRSLAMIEEFDVQLWRDVVFPRMNELRTHHLLPESMADVGMIVSMLDLLAPKEIQDLDYLKSEKYQSLKPQALASIKLKRNITKYPLSRYTPSTEEEKKAGLNKSTTKDQPKFRNNFTGSISNALCLLNEEFDLNTFTPSPYSLPLELLVRKKVVIKPIATEDHVLDSFQLMGMTRVILKMLRKLGYPVVEVYEKDWIEIPKKLAPRQLTKVIRLAHQKNKS